MAGRGEQQRGGVIGEDRGRGRGDSWGVGGWVGVSSTAEEAQGHSEIPRRGRKIGKIDRSDGETKKKGSQIPTWAGRRWQKLTD